MKQIIERYKAKIEEQIKALSEMEICEKNVNSMYHMLTCYDKIIDIIKDEDFS